MDYPTIINNEPNIVTLDKEIIKSNNELNDVSKNENSLNNSNINTSNNLITKKKKNSTKKCNHITCNKKLTIVDRQLSCKCKKFFCISHRMPEQHNCEFSFKDNENVICEKIENTKCIADKLNKI
tara:strand:+ start:441 stop:815 length:375 start_codon:yes stop_codon:yes gene_type:complete